MTSSLAETGAHLRLVKDPPQIPPHDDDAERAVISAAIIDATAMPKVVDFLRPEHFYSESHRRIFEACTDLFARREPIDLVQVASWLRDRQRLEQVGGMPYLTEVLDGSPVVANVRSHAIAVHEDWRKRQTIAICQKVAAYGYGPVPDAQEFIDRAVRAVARVGAQNPVKPIEDNAAAIKRIIADVTGMAVSGEDPGKLKATGYPTGLFSLDQIIGGFAPGHKTTVVATTGVGKSAIAVQCAVHVAKQNVGVFYVSLEMKREEHLRRAIACESGVSSSKAKARCLSGPELASYVAAAERLVRLHMRVDDTPGVTIEHVRSVVAAFQEECRLIRHVPLGLVVLDMVHKLEPSPRTRGKDRRHELAHMSNQFKLLCRELNVAGLELAQGKDLEIRNGKKVRPTPNSAVYECSDIAKDADELIVLIRETDDDKAPVQDYSACVIKQRDGRRGEVSLRYVSDMLRFEDPHDLMRCPSRDYVDDRAIDGEYR